MSDFLYPSTPASLFRVSGTDARRYLHGRLTQAVKSLKAGQGTKSLLLSPQGKIQGQMLLLCRDDDFLIVSDLLADKDAETSFVTNLLQFKVADRVEVENCSSQYRAQRFLGINTKNVLNDVLKNTPSEKFSHTQPSEELIVVNHPLGDVPGFTLLSKTGSEVNVSSAAVTKGSIEEFEVARIQNKVPMWGVDLNDKVLGSEIDYQELISFTKGCYAGQEAIEMSVARGRPPRRLVKLETKELINLSAGDEIQRTSEDTVYGVITSSITVADIGTVALGLIRNVADSQVLVKNHHFSVS